MQKSNMHRKQIYSGGITNKLDRFRFGNYALVARSNGIITVEQLNAARIAIKKKIRGFGKLWICIRPNKSITRKSCGIRMGKGKGSFYKFIYFVKKDEILMELELGRFRDFAKKLLLLGSSKLGIYTSVRCK